MKYVIIIDTTQKLTIDNIDFTADGKPLLCTYSIAQMPNEVCDVIEEYEVCEGERSEPVNQMVNVMNH